MGDVQEKLQEKKTNKTSCSPKEEGKSNAGRERKSSEAANPHRSGVSGRRGSPAVRAGGRPAGKTGERRSGAGCWGRTPTSPAGPRQKGVPAGRGVPPPRRCLRPLARGGRAARPAGCRCPQGRRAEAHVPPPARPDPPPAGSPAGGSGRAAAPPPPPLGPQVHAPPLRLPRFGPS